ncbi:MAG TPA: hypothetical protein VG028_13445 [Terriglobia bacterium]|nr:hypothetical protein [Terriglobia bacterium]
MQILFCIFAYLAIAALARGQGAVEFFYSDFRSSPSAIRQFKLYPTQVSYTNGAGDIVTVDRYVTNTGLAGSFIISNVLAGGYRGEIAGGWSPTTNYFNFPATNAGALLNAKDWLTVLTNQVPAGSAVAYSQAQSDGRYLQSVSNADGTIGIAASGQGIVVITAASGMLATNNQSLVAPRFSSVGSPDLGWSTYPDYVDQINQTIVTNWVQEVLTNGMFLAGWTNIYIDDGWASTNDPTTYPVYWNTNRFPLGMPWLVQYCHTNGFSVWLYDSQCGTGGNGKTTMGYDASGDFGPHLYQDVRLWASWGVDGVRYDDSCLPSGVNSAETRELVRVFNEASQDAGEYAGNGVSNRVMKLTIGVSAGSSGAPPPWGSETIPYEVANSASHITIGNAADPSSMTNMVGQFRPGLQFLQWFTGPFHHVDSLASLTSYEMGGASPHNYQTNIAQSTVNCALMGPQTAMWDNPFGNPLWLAYATNLQVQSLWLDAAQIPGSVLWSNNFTEIWKRPIGGLQSGTNAILFINLQTTTQAVGFSAGMLGLSSNVTYTLYDPWSQATVGSFNNSGSVSVAPTNTLLLVAAPQTIYLPENLALNGVLQISNSFGEVVLADPAIPSGYDAIIHNNGYENHVISSYSASSNATTLQTAGGVVKQDWSGANAPAWLGSKAPVALTAATETNNGVTYFTGKGFSPEYLKANNVVLTSASQLSVTAQSDAPWVFDQGWAVAYNVNASWSIPVPPWVTQVTFTYSVETSAASSWTNTYYPFSFPATGRVLGSPINQFVGSTNNLQTYSVAVPFPAAATAKSLYMFVAATTNTATRYIVPPFRLDYQ